MTREDEILLSSFNIKKALSDHRDLFNFNKLSIDQKLYLLSVRGIYEDSIKVETFSPDEKASLLLNAGLNRLHKLAEIKEEDLHKIHYDNYYHLLCKNFKKYARKDLFEKLTNSQKSELFIKQPEWIHKNVESVPKLTSSILRELAYKRHDFINEYVTDFSKLATCNDFWIRMIKHDPKYMGVFLNNTKSLLTKTDVRSVVRTWPGIIKLLNKDNITDSKLSVKEWILLIDIVLGSPAGEKVLKDWQLGDDLIEIFKGDLLAEMLSGKSKMSVRFKNAMKGVFGTEEEI